VVLGKLDRFDWEIERRLSLGASYRRQILDRGLPVELLTVRPDRDCVWAQFTVFVNDRAALQQRLQALGVPTAVHYPKPLHLQPAYAQFGAGLQFPASLEASQRVMSLPMSPDLREEDIVRVVDALHSATATR